MCDSLQNVKKVKFFKDVDAYSRLRHVVKYWYLCARKAVVVPSIVNQCLIINLNNMTFFKSWPISIIEAGPERELMARILFGTKRIKGLTRALVQLAGVKSQWLKPDEPRNIPSKRLLRITLHTMYHLDREEFKQRVDALIDYTYDHILPDYADMVDHQTGKRKQRPPSIRRLYRRRYLLSSVTVQRRPATFIIVTNFYTNIYE